MAKILKCIYLQGICVIDKYLYTCGGTTGWEYNIDVRRLDLSTHEWELLDVTQSQREHLQHYRRKVGTPNFRIGKIGPGLEIFLCKQPDADAFRDTPTATGSLISASLRNGFDWQTLNLALYAVSRNSS